MGIGACLLLGGGASAASLTVRALDDKGGMLEHVAIALTPSGGATVPRASGPVEIGQQDKTFIPLVSTVQTGTAVNFPNRDTVRHHVYSFSPAKSFELKLYIGTPAKPVVFDRPGIVVLGCNIHDHMVAYVMVADTPWQAVTDASGTARLSGFPDGDYELRVWHPSLLGRAELPPKRVRIEGDGRETVAIPGGN